MTIPLPFMILLCLLTRPCFGCPPSCTCKWRNGKQTVECVHKSLVIIPEGLDPATQVLDISGNNFQYLQREKFLSLGLVNLQKIFLNQCNIKTIQNDAFKGLSNLVELDLAENNLETVPTDALLNCPSLMKLSLSKNPISSINRLAFNHLSFLTTLDLSGCEIAEVHEAAFSGLYSLEWIDLSQNEIRSFPDMRLFPNTLKGVQLQDNQWTCDCHIRTFSAWLKRDIVPILVPPVCQNPRKFRGLPVRSMEESELACAPKVSPESFYFVMEESGNISLLCQAKSVPTAKISWLFKGQVLHNNTELAPGLHLVYFLEEGGEEKQSNLFIYNLNSEDNGTFYCQAENSAGIAYANYTIMIILKRKPMAIEEKLEFPFPVEIVSALFAVGLVILSLCFVALLMTLIRCHSESKRRKQRYGSKDKFIADTKAGILKNSNFKETDERTRIFKAKGNIKDTTDGSYQVSDLNPDLINVVNSKDISDRGQKVSGTKVPGSLPLNSMGLGPSTIQKHNPSTLVGPALAQRNLNRQRTQPYLKPTITSQQRPVSAPSFERFVENYDVRYTADGYPARQVDSIGLYKSSTMIESFSEASTPKARRNQIKRLNKVGTQTLNNVEQVKVLDDVQL